MRLGESVLFDEEFDEICKSAPVGTGGVSSPPPGLRHKRHRPLASDAVRSFLIVRTCPPRRHHLLIESDNTSSTLPRGVAAVEAAEAAQRAGGYVYA